MKFVAIGDSVMWGQGLRDEEKFVVRAAKAIAESAGQLFRREDLTLLAHSGAPIFAKPARDRTPLSMTNRDIKERNDYCNEFSFVFDTPEKKARFLRYGDLPNQRLSGEIPRDFPTVLDQLEMYPVAQAGSVDVVFVSGGANDLDFVQFMTQRNTPLEADQAEIQRVLLERYAILLRETLRKFPKAVVIAIGYYPILSNGTSLDQLKTMAYDIKDIPAGSRDANEFLQTSDRVPGLGWFWDVTRWIFSSENVGEYARKAIQYNQNAYYAATQTARKVIDTIGDPRLHFIEPGLSGAESLFGSDSHIFEGYLDSLSNDPAKAIRVSAGNEWFDAYDQFHRVTSQAQAHAALQDRILALKRSLNNAPQEEVTRINKEIETLQNEFEAYYRSLPFQRQVYLAERRGRMPIFSFLHPNAKGADAYFQSIMARWEALTKSQSLRSQLLPKGGSVKAYRTRFQCKPSNLRLLNANDKLEQLVLRFSAKQWFFRGFDAGFVNALKVNLRTPINGLSFLTVPNLKVNSFASFVDPVSGLPRALDANDNELWGYFPIFMNQLGNIVGFDKLRLSNIASVELSGTQLPNVVDSPQMLVGNTVPIVILDAQMHASRLEVFAGQVSIATSTTVPLWKKKNGLNPKITLAVPQ